MESFILIFVAQGQGQGQIQLFDAKWMEIFEYNLTNDMIFVVSDYLQVQLRQTFRERETNSEEEVSIWEIIENKL